jgi:hypothetical protein
MNKSVALPCVVILLASIAAGCGSSGNIATSSSVPTPVPSPSSSCTPPAGYTIQEVFPQNGQGNQPNLEGVVFDVGPSPQPGNPVPSPLPTNWFFYVTYNVATNDMISSYPQSIGFLATAPPSPAPGASASATPFPTPSDSPTNAAFTNYIQESASNGIFSNSAVNPAQFTVYLANSNCYPGIPESTFSTAPYDAPSPSPSPTGT